MNAIQITTQGSLDVMADQPNYSINCALNAIMESGFITEKALGAGIRVANALTSGFICILCTGLFVFRPCDRQTDKPWSIVDRSLTNMELFRESDRPCLMDVRACLFMLHAFEFSRISQTFANLALFYNFDESKLETILVEIKWKQKPSEPFKYKLTWVNSVLNLINLFI